MPIFNIPWIYVVRGSSMKPCLNSGDVLLVKRPAKASAAIQRGDIVIANNPAGADRYYAKRVVGLPTEQVALRDGLLTIDDEHLVEPYLNGLPANLGLACHAWELNAGEYFLMGDNRAHSTDSRGYGPVASGAIVGRASRCLWPPRRWRKF